MRIGILGERDEPEVKVMGERLAERGVETHVLDLSSFPKTRALSIECTSAGVRVLDGREDLSDVGAWYVRRFGFVDPLLREPVTQEAWNDIYGKFREWVAVDNQVSMTVASLLEFLAEGAAVINPPAAFIGHMRKPHQVHLIQKAGLPVPDFLVTNDADAARAFIDRHDDRVVYKPVAGGRHAREIGRAHFDQRAHALATEPILLQAVAEGRHIRAYVVGERVVGAGEIDFDRTEGIDYRKTQRGALAIGLPDHVQRDCVRAARACGMPFTGLDVIWDDANGSHLFLECNPSPMFANFERMTGHDVSGPLADLLVESAKSRR